MEDSIRWLLDREVKETSKLQGYAGYDYENTDGGGSVSSLVKGCYEPMGSSFPECKDNRCVWHFICGNGNSGWVSEEDNIYMYNLSQSSRSGTVTNWDGGLEVAIKKACDCR